MGAKPQPFYNRICVINNSVIMRLQCTIIIIISEIVSYVAALTHFSIFMVLKAGFEFYAQGRRERFCDLE